MITDSVNQSYLEKTSLRKRGSGLAEMELKHTSIMAPFVCWKVVFFWKVNSGKVNYFPMFGSVMKNKLENTFQCLVMSWKMSWKITY
jgi:hypothetical protein